MKKTSLFLLGIVCALSSLAQTRPHFGVKGGLNIGTMKFSNVSKNNMDPRFGFHLGGTAHIHVTDAVAIQPELLYSTEGAKQKVGNGEEVTWKTDYINVPIMLQYMFDNGFRLEAGPQFGLMVSGKSEDQDGIEANESDFFKSANVSLGFGLSYLSYSGIGVGGRYNAGLSNVLEDGYGTGKNNTFQVSLFYMLDKNHKRQSR